MKGLIIDRESGDLLIERGGIAIGDTEAQTAEAVIMAMRGEFKEYPLLGGEAARQLAGSGNVMWGGEVRKMLKACGVECDKVTVTPDGIIEII